MNSVGVARQYWGMLGKQDNCQVAAIYVTRGLDKELASQVATQLTAHDALGAHARDELGISSILSARPLQAAVSSAATFALGALMPVLVVWCSPFAALIPIVSGTTLLFLGLLGFVAARTGGARTLRGTVRVIVWGALAMVITTTVGIVFGIAG